MIISTDSVAVCDGHEVGQWKDGYLDAVQTSRSLCFAHKQPDSSRSSPVKLFWTLAAFSVWSMYLTTVFVWPRSSDL